ncbi:helix-turn-helix transcriptional regulator [Bacillus sp. RO3]|nr:helix-turn-helix transcriptional regulator [Bacillus sp. RO3]
MIDKEEIIRRKEFGNSIRSERLKMKLSIKEVSNHSNISEYAIANIEHGLVSPDISGMNKRLMRAIHQEKMVIK